MATTTQSTFTAGDVITGGAGTDALSLTLEGAPGAGWDLAAASVSGVETFNIRNLTNGTVTVNADRFTGESNLVNDRSTAAVAFTNIGSADVTVIGDGSSTIGATSIDVGATSVTDAFTLNINGGTKGTNNITVADTDADWTSATINSTGAANTVGTIGLTNQNSVTSLTINADKGLTASGITGFKTTGATVTVAGATTANVSIGTLDSAVTSIDGSGLTAAGLTATTAVATAAIVGGQGNDSITIGVAKTTTGTTALGAGVDAVTTTADNYIDTATKGALITGAETLNISHTSTISTTFADRSQDVSLVSGITKVGLTTLTLVGSASDDTDEAVSVSFTKLSAAVADLTISGISYSEADTSGSEVDDDVALTVSAARATDSTADSLAITLGSASAETGVGMAATTDALTLSITVDNEETLSIASTGAANYITALTAADATSLTLTGSKALTIAGVTAANLRTVDASAMTGAVSVVSVNNLANTITGGSANDTLLGGTGADSIIGNAGEDSLTAGAGNDYVSGGAGNDTLIAEDGSDTVDGGDGVDAITGGSGMDNLSGGAGNDTFIVAAQADFVSTVGSVETVDGGDGALDVLQFAASGGDVTLAAASLAGLVGIEKIEYLETDNALSMTLTDAIMTSNGHATLTIDADTVTTGTISVSAAALTSTNSIILDADTTTYSGGGTIALGSGADRVILDADALDNAFTSLNGGAGTDTLTISLQTTNSNITFDADVKLFEVINFTNGDNYYVTTRDDNVASGATMTVNGDALTSTLRFEGGNELNGNFVMTGGAAADSLTGGSGNDSLTGGSGSDVLAGGTGNDTISGGDDADSIEGGDGNDVVDAGAGNDASINGGAGIDSLDGGAGNDTFIVAASADFVSLSASETVIGGAGTDTLKFNSGIAWTISSSDLNLSSIEVIEFATTTNNVAITLTDVVMAANGNATVTIDADTITAGALTVAAGNLTSSYAVRVDMDTTCLAEAGSHNIVLGAGNDTVIAELDDLDTSALTITGGSGTDTLQITDAGDASATGSQITLDNGITGFETITFTTAADTFNIKTDSLTVASGATLTVSGGSLTGVLYFDGSSETDGYFNIASGGGNDSIVGGTLADTISSGSGVDTITGGLGADSLTGGAGNDIFVFANVSQSGGTSVDTITDWTTAADKLQVTLDYSSLSSALEINATLLGTGAATLSTIQDGLTGKRGEAQYNVETSQLVINFNNDNLITASDYKIGLNAASTATATVVGSDINFIVTGGSGSDSIVSGSGADTIIGYIGTDTINGGAGNDVWQLATGNVTSNAVTQATDATITNIETIEITGNTAITLTLTGQTEAFTITATGTGGHTIVGGNAADSITGSAVNDNINGGAGNDTIVGGAGADTILFDAASGTDTVYLSAATTATTADGSINLVIYNFATAASITGVGVKTIYGYGSSDIIEFTAGLLVDAAGHTTTGSVSVSSVVAITQTADASVADALFFLYTATGELNATEVAGGATSAAAQIAGWSVVSTQKAVFILDDGTDSYLWSYIGSSTNATTADAAELTLIGIVKGVTVMATGDFLVI